MQRCVLDTNVVASALLWGGKPRALLDAARRGDIALFASVPMMRELTAVLARRKFEDRIAASRLGVDGLVDGYVALLDGLVRPAIIDPVCRNPKDDVVLATALAADAGLIVSGDRDLLVMARWHDVEIMTVADANDLLRT